MNNQPTSEERLQYYKSWASYQIPMRPVDPIDFAQTEPLTSFYLATFDQSNRLKRFVKYLVERKSVGIRHLQGRSAPNSVVYFAALPSSAASEVDMGKALVYQDTAGCSVYFRGVVDSTGDQADLQMVRRSIFFTDEYSYWPNGQLKERVMTKKDGTVVKTRFDEHGTVIK